MDIPKNKIRQPIVEGLFYSDEPETLKREIGEYLEAGSPGKARIILCPHGSLKHCGKAMGAAFAAASDSAPDRILLIAPVHREAETTGLVLPESDYFASPLGVRPIDTELRKDLEGELFVRDEIPHQEEHALELTLPFLELLFPDVPVLPVLTGRLNRGLIRKAAARLAGALKKRAGRTLIVISANLSRYAQAEESAAEADYLLEQLSLPLKASLLEKERAERCGSCGLVPLTLVSDLLEKQGVKEPAAPELVLRQSAEHREKETVKSVHYGGLCWRLS